MIELFIDTSYKRTMISIISNNDIIGSIDEPSENNVSETLFLLMEKLLNETKINIKQIQKVYVSVGPGSFTGVRIGVTFAKTMAWALKIPVVPISSLEILATTSVNEEYIVPYIDAGHNYLYAGIYRNNMEKYIEDIYISVEELIEKIPKDKEVVFISYDNVIKDFNTTTPSVDIIKIISKYKPDKGINAHELKPNYLKKSSAEEKND